MIFFNIVPLIIEFTPSWWIGANDIDSEGNWEWVPDKRSLDFPNWASNEPVTDTNINCARLYNDRKWRTQICGGVTSFICETKLE
jgi:hypothetical protein